MQRRALFSFAGAALLAGCGFQLRKPPDFAFDTLVVNAPESSPLGAELRRSVAAEGKVRVLTAAAAPAPAASAASAPAAASATRQVTFDLLQEQREKVVVGLNSSGQVTEFQLRSRIRFRVRDAQGRELIPDTELEQHRDISFNESAVLAKEAEESLLYRDMQTDLVQQLMRRLAAVRPQA
ncbi:hypothetical protein H8N03_21665 [Ramlibacter sp. USB13]|uniref:LPS-assembly lipoprotein LptE n=1 Tax=Ramlibacter cellulosilyticus TaxID=2764187 RepID=A0A923SDP9_9BURK|nr:LPS assembly lipoprotein LptE [Ramlibacter cellulosilyticus]MBC5785563.1 hypothetical protein [Ramlibacter cellulosilyticus]